MSFQPFNLEENYYPLVQTGVIEPAPSQDQTNTPPTKLNDSNLQNSANGTVMTQGTLESPNFATGASGWQINSDGNVEFGNGKFRGAVSASTIDIPNATTVNSFHTDANGNSWWGATTLAAAPASITKAGAITGTSVTITGGTISIVTKKITISTTPVSITNTATETDILAATSIPANTLGTNNGLRIKMMISDFDFAKTATFTIALKYGATTVASVALTGDATTNFSDMQGDCECLVLASGATNTQKGVGKIFVCAQGFFATGANNPIGTQLSIGTGAEDSTAAKNLNITGKFNVASVAGFQNSITIDNILVEQVSS